MYKAESGQLRRADGWCRPIRDFSRGEASTIAVWGLKVGGMAWPCLLAVGAKYAAGPCAAFEKAACLPYQPAGFSFRLVPELLLLAL